MGESAVTAAGDESALVRHRAPGGSYSIAVAFLGPNLLMRPTVQPCNCLHWLQRT